MAGRPPLHDEAHRRRLIEAAAAAVFAEAGFADATIDEIVARSGISKPAVYRVYGSKAHLYAALIEAAAHVAAAAALDAFAAARAHGDDALGAMIDAWFAQVERDPTAIRLAVRDVPDDPVIVAAHERARAMQVANDVALIGLLAPHVPDIEREPLGEVIRSSLLTLATWWLDHPEVGRHVPVNAMMRVCAGIARPPG